MFRVERQIFDDEMFQAFGARLWAEYQAIGTLVQVQTIARRLPKAKERHVLITQIGFIDFEAQRESLEQFATEVHISPEQLTGRYH